MADAVPFIAPGYTVIRELGGGGMSRIFLARDEALGREVVLKLLSLDLAEGLSAERFAREIRLAAVLQEPHIVPVLNAGQTAEGLPWYTMPFVDGESLRERLTRGKPTLGEAVGLLRNVAQALTYAHAHHVVHRDIKPENILISSGTAVVADFGIAKALSAAKTKAPGGTLTQIGSSLGTPAYIAPEQAVGDAATDHRADLYSWGVVAYETLSGRHPFADKTSAQQLVAAHIAEIPRPLGDIASDLPPGLVSIVMRCLEKDPNRRTQSAAEVVDALSNVSTGTTPSSFTAAVAPSPVAHRSRAAIITGIVVAAVAIAAPMIWLRGRPPGPAPAADTRISTVAVLPFENLSGDPKDEYFSDGMTDELANALSQLPGVRLAGRTSSFSFKGKHPIAQEVGRVLNVDGVIDGTVRRSGDRLRISAQLSSTKDGLVLWSKTVEKGAAEAFQVQDEVTREMIATIAPAFATTATLAETNRGTTNAEAYDLYLRGRYFWLKRGTANLNQGIALFQRAIAKDPAFARAHSGLATSYVVMRTYVAARPDSLAALATASADRAIALDSTLGEAYAAKAYAQLANLRLREAEQTFQIAIAREPANPTIRHWHAIALNGLGLTDSASAEAARAEAIDPLSAVFANHHGLTMMFQGRLDDARARLRRAIELDSAFTLPYANLGLVEIASGVPERAIALLENASADVRDRPRTQTSLALAYASVGRWSDYDRIVRDARLSSDRLLPSLINGDTAAALTALERGFTPAGGMIYGLVNPACDLHTVPLRNEPRYKALLARLGVQPCAHPMTWKIPIRPKF